MFKTESYKKGVAYSSLLNIVSKIFLFLQSILIAYYFGTTRDTDFFFFCLSMVNIGAAFINALDYTVLIPESMKRYYQTDPGKAMHFLNFFIFLYLFIGLFVSIGVLGFPVAVTGLVSDFDLQFIEKNRAVVLFALPLFGLSVLNNFLTAILASFKYFTMPIFAGLINNFLAVVFIVAFHDHFSLVSIYIGLITGYLINLLIILYIMKSKLNWEFSPRRASLDRAVFRNIFFSQAGNVTSLLAAYVPVKMLSAFSHGILSSLTFGQKTSEMPSQIITNQVSQVAAIKFNELYAQKRYGELNRVFNELVEVLFFILIPVSFIFCIYGKEIISVLFQRGEFENRSVEFTAVFFQIFSLLLPFMAVNTFVSRLLMAGQFVKQGAVYQVGINFFLIIFIFIALKVSGATGYPLALNAFYFLNFLFCFFLLRFYFPFIEYKKVIINYFKIVLLNLLPFGLLYFGNEFLHGNYILKIIEGSIFYVALVLLANRVFKISPMVNSEMKLLIQNYSNGRTRK